MSAYHVVLVRFDGGQQSYPVNGHDCWRIGDRVVVEMAGDPPSLARAEVVGLSFAKKPCRHSIRGRESDPTSFLPGPHGVHDRDDLIRYLEGYGFRAVPVVILNCNHEPSPSPEFTVGYLCGYDPAKHGQDQYVQLPGRIVLVGEHSAGIHYPTQHGHLFIGQKDGRLVFSTYNRIDTFPHDEGTPFHRVAMALGGDLSYPVESKRQGEYIPFDFNGD